MRIDWAVAKARLAREYPQLTDDELRFAEGHEDELIARLQERTGASGEALEKIFRGEEDGPPAGAGDGPNDDAGLRGSGIPENTSHSGLSGI
jgi:hypothetical protein